MQAVVVTQCAGLNHTQSAIMQASRTNNSLMCREDERLKRIRDEGYDRFAPINETNRPPDSVPSKRPPVDSDSD